jgi:cysteine desulfurase/selenocysteine lyase
MLDFDLQTARRDTPGCDNVLHFNNAGAALMPKQVLQSCVDHLQLESRIGGYEAAALSHESVERVYTSAALLLKCNSCEIAVVENATRAWDMVFYSIPFKATDRILTSAAEYASNYIAYLQMARRTGVKVEVIPNDEYGQVSVKALRNMLDQHVKLIAISHVPTNGGLINPAAEIGKVAREANTLYLLDACQSIGQMPIYVNEIGCNMLSATSRKYLRGPRGSGFLYVQHNLLEDLEPPFLDLHAAKWTAKNHFEIRSDARRFETWETNIAAKIGLGVAIEYALKWGLEAIWARISLLAQMLRIRLAELDGLITLHDQGVEKCGIVTFSIKGKDSNTIRRKLSEQRINVSVSLPEDTRVDMDERKLGTILRASVHYYNSEDEIERFIRAITCIGAKP